MWLWDRQYGDFHSTCSQVNTFQIKSVVWVSAKCCILVCILKTMILCNYSVQNSLVFTIAHTDTLEAKQYCMLLFLLCSNIIHHTIVGNFDSTSMNILLDTFEITLFIYILTWKQTDTVIFPYLNNIINDWIQLMKIFIYFALFY